MTLVRYHLAKTTDQPEWTVRRTEDFCKADSKEEARRLVEELNEREARG